MFEWIKLFDSLSLQEKQNLALFCQERIIPTWEMLFSEWDDANAMYVVKSWMLKVYRDRSDWEKVLGYLSNNEIVWEMALFDINNWVSTKKRMASVKAMEDSVILIIMDYSILELSKKHIETFDKIKKVVEDRKNENKRYEIL